MPDDGINRDELWEIVLVFAPVEMSLGKAAGQAFQAAFRMRDVVHHEENRLAWIKGGTRTIVKVAKTPAIFERICEEVPGYVMRDEGFTEVEADTATLFVSHPFLHMNRPKVLDNKKVSLL